MDNVPYSDTHHERNIMTVDEAKQIIKDLPAKIDTLNALYSEYLED